MRLYILILILASFWSSTAAAAAPQLADALIEQGVGLREKHQYQEALDLFLKADALWPSARVVAQMGLAEAKLRRWVDAETHLVAALGTHDTSWIKNAQNRAALAEALGLVRTHIGLVAVVGPSGAQIAVAGIDAGRLPLAGPIHVPEGVARMEGAADGREPASVDLRVVGGTEMTVHLDLPLKSVPYPHADVVGASSDTMLAVGAPSSESMSWKTWSGAGLLAISAGLIATGAVWVAIDGDNTCSASASGHCTRVFDTKTEGFAAVGAGVVAGAVGAILFWQGQHADTGVALGLGTVMATGRF